MASTSHNPCRNFAEGNCKFGRRCRYSHDPSTPCYFLRTRNGCPKGDSCVFSHEQDSSSRQPRVPQSPPTTEPDFDKRFRQWTYLIPREHHGRRAQHMTPDTEQFFVTGWKLMDSADTSGRQKLIKKLSSEEGLGMIKAVTDAMSLEAEDQIVLASFDGSVMPLYQIISHPEVLSSLVLESPIDTIYNFLYGSGGRRGVAVFTFTAKAISLAINWSDGDEDSGSLNSLLRVCLGVLWKLVELNQGAQLQEELTPAVETITVSVGHDNMLPESRRTLDRIRLRLGLGSLLPVAKRSKQQAVKKAAFEFQYDLPGPLSCDGQRHDNDHDDITKIQILPTAEEIHCPRQEYLPYSDTTNTHLTGLPALIDRQFRLLREDAIGGLRDAVRREAERLEKGSIQTATTRMLNQERTHVHANLRFRRWEIDRRKGIQLVVEFDQPIFTGESEARQRKDWWESSRRLQPTSLVCLVSSSGRSFFCLVCDPTPTAPVKKKHRNDDEEEEDPGPSPADLEYQRKKSQMPSLYTDGKKAAVMLTLIHNDWQHIAWISRQMNVFKSTGSTSLVEFPGVLLPSFQPTLKALQDMSESLDLPFTEHLAPDVPGQELQEIAAPAYTQRRGFFLDLSPLTNGQALILSAEKPFDWNALSENTSLDEAQQAAVIHALQNGLALIQGPPGTGKSYTGVSIIKVLLHNRKACDLGPIICVCYTNHALDQLLEHLIKDGVKQVVRIGSQSKSEMLQNVNLQQLAQEVPVTKEESRDKWSLNQSLNSSITEIDSLLRGLSTLASEDSIKTYLEEHSPLHFRQLFGSAMEEDGFTLVKARNDNVIKHWLRGGGSENLRSLPIDYLNGVSVHDTTASERSRLLSYWIKERAHLLGEQLDDALGPYKEVREELDKYFKEQQLRALSEAHVIGVTTSGLARNLDVLRRLRSKVLVCEEAGEVLEAHTLTALLPSIEHAILIGDHEQLRPQVKNYELCHDNPRGKRLALDISLFERLVKPEKTLNPSSIPFSRLKIQRRMYPSIADLVRNTIYPDLEDHETVRTYPNVDGMKRRMFWMTHQHKEDGADHNQAQSDSKSNDFEVSLVSALASHLIRQGTYSNGDIAILTPYVRQLQKIRRSLGGMLEIVVNDRDMEALEAQGDATDQPLATMTSGSSKSTLLRALRVATVDNFQGEEAKVIILSFVRCNAERKCGFLRTSNRINVALSRARHGMYIIGDAGTASSVPMWAEVVNLLAMNDTCAALAIQRLQSSSSHPTISPSFRQKAVAASGAHRDCSAAMLALTNATVKHYMQLFTALSAVIEQKQAAGTNAKSHVVILAIPCVRSKCQMFSFLAASPSDAGLAIGDVSNLLRSVEEGKEEDGVVELLASGGYNDIWLVKRREAVFEGEERFVLRRPKEGALVPDQVRNEVGCLGFVRRELPGVPVPRVYDYRFDGIEGGGVFIAEEFVEGRRLSDVWSSFDEAAKYDVARQIAKIVVGLGEATFDGIGGIMLDGTLGPTVEGMKLFKGRVYRIVSTRTIITTSDPTAPPSNTSSPATTRKSATTPTRPTATSITPSSRTSRATSGSNS
ncbi:MAG: hypothetical protein Q9222_001758 [Ikaeria aurantiellina]